MTTRDVTFHDEACAADRHRANGFAKLNSLIKYGLSTDAIRSEISGGALRVSVIRIGESPNPLLTHAIMGDQDRGDQVLRHSCSPREVSAYQSRQMFLNFIVGEIPAILKCSASTLVSGQVVDVYRKLYAEAGKGAAYKSTQEFIHFLQGVGCHLSSPVSA